MKKVMRLTENDLHNIVQESVQKVIKEGIGSGSPIRMWNYWCANFENDFIQRAWADNPNLAHHLQNKFDSYYDAVGSYGVMNKFYLNLSSDNQEILENYVLNNYRG